MSEHDFIAKFIKENIQQIKRVQSSSLRLLLVKQVQDELFELSPESRAIIFNKYPEVKRDISELSNFQWILNEEELTNNCEFEVPEFDIIESPPTEISEVVIETPEDCLSTSEPISTASTNDDHRLKLVDESYTQIQSLNLPASEEKIDPFNMTNSSGSQISQTMISWKPLESFSFRNIKQDSHQSSGGKQEKVSEPVNSTFTKNETQAKGIDSIEKRLIVKDIIMTGKLPMSMPAQSKRPIKQSQSNIPSRRRQKKIVGGDTIRSWLSEMYKKNKE